MHECPISMLRDSQAFNDGDYCLVHLMAEQPAYCKYFLEARNLWDREVFLDTSVFELGTAFDPVKYMDWAEKIKPNLMIIPDVLENALETKNSWEEFTGKFGDRLSKIDARRIGVVQGKTYEELKACYLFMSRVADVIAISFDMSFYDTFVVSGANKLERMCTGRPSLIDTLIKDGVWNWNKPHHLLGISLPQEMNYYVRNNKVF